MKKKQNFATDLSKEIEFIELKEKQNAVTLHLPIFDSSILNQDEKEIIFIKLYHHINNKGILTIQSFYEQTVEENKTSALNKLNRLLQMALKPAKKSKKTNSERSLIFR